MNALTWLLAAWAVLSLFLYLRAKRKHVQYRAILVDWENAGWIITPKVRPFSRHPYQVVAQRPDAKYRYRFASSSVGSLYQSIQKLNPETV